MRKNKVFDRKKKILDWVCVSVLAGISPLVVNVFMEAFKGGVFTSWANGLFFLAMALFIEINIITSCDDMLSLLFNRFSIFGLIVSVAGAVATICLPSNELNEIFANSISIGICLVASILALSANLNEWRESEGKKQNKRKER